MMYLSYSANQCDGGVQREWKQLHVPSFEKEVRMEIEAIHRQR